MKYTLQLGRGVPFEARCREPPTLAISSPIQHFFCLPLQFWLQQHASSPPLPMTFPQFQQPKYLHQPIFSPKKVLLLHAPLPYHAKPFQAAVTKCDNYIHENKKSAPQRLRTHSRPNGTSQWFKKKSHMQNSLS